MKITLWRILLLILIFAFLTTACTQPTPTKQPAAPTATTPPAAEVTSMETAVPTSVAKPEEPIYLAIIWHQHQPVYFKDPETGIYAKPWARVHATKDYVDMAAILKQYPDIHVTFNLTPSLIRQLDDLKEGTKDLYWVVAEVPADQLTQEQKQFLLDRFFDTNRKVISRFPRYQELLEKRDNNVGEAINVYTTEDFRDLQVLFNLAWVDPDWLAQEPLAGLVQKAQNISSGSFNEADKQVLFAEHKKLIDEVIPVHKEMQDAGQIEVTMTPFAHPILPLLITTNLAQQAIPDITLPGKSFVFGQDAVAQVQLGVQMYQEHFGRMPRGMWPAEGSVAQEVISMVASAGIEWMASDEGVLANSLGMSSFVRGANDLVTEPDKLYRPYYVEGRQGGPVGMVFRDVVISDKVGFTYSGLPGNLAAKDFIKRIQDIRTALRESGAKGPHLVSVILDGENAWEYYDNDGKEFLHSLYQYLSSDPTIKTVTPSEFLKLAPDQPKLEKLWAGSWISHDFSTWIGEDEENRAWEYLATTREVLQNYITGIRQVSPEVLEQAKIQMYIAEGSDWFWWFGSDQNSGNDDAFDLQFRETLKQVYTILGEEAPGSLDVPIIPMQAVSADVAARGLLTPGIDGQDTADEWENAGIYKATGGVMASSQSFFDSLSFGFDKTTIYFKVNISPDFTFPAGESHFELYLRAGKGATNNFSRGGTLIGFPANYLVDVTFLDGMLKSSSLHTANGDETWKADGMVLTSTVAGPGIVELGVPLELLNKPDTGDRLSMRAFYRNLITVEGQSGMGDSDNLPGSGPAVVLVPDLGTMTVLVDIDDPLKDDYGPGNYTYARDGVFQAGSFDITNFQIGYDDNNVIFKFTMRGPVDNPWGSGIGLSIQTLDIYIDKDRDGQGGIELLPGRNLALQDGSAWDYAIWVEGWESGIYQPTGKGPEKIASASQFTILADPAQRRVTVKVPMAILGDDPQNWQYAAIVLGQEGYPSPGVWRVRDVTTSAAQWRFGGAPADATNHTRVMDWAWPVAGEQEKLLSDFDLTDLPQDQLSAANFARIPLITIK